MEIISQKTIKARKEHKCDMCGRTIQPGDSYELGFYKDGADVWDWKNCHKCLPTVEKMWEEELYCLDVITADNYEEYVREHGEV